MTVDLAKAMRVARHAVEAASEVALSHRRQGVEVEQKSDGSPVTAADKACEQAIASIILEAFPDHGMLGEEGGERQPGSESRWIVDPIDGTRGYIRGESFWGPLVALEHRGTLVVGAMALPVLQETYWAARGLGAFLDGRRLQLSHVAHWREATLSIGSFRRVGDRMGAGVQRLVRSAARVRCHGDVGSIAMVLRGEADCWIEAGVRYWDLAPAAVLIEEAGGRCTDAEGGADFARGTACATNGLLHEQVLRELAGS